MALAHSTQLGCGRDIDEVWAKADAPPDAHEAGCPDCQAARESLAALNTATDELRHRDQHDPALRLSSEVLTKITAIARAEVRRGRRIPLRYPPPEADAPELTVSELAVATVVRRTCDQLSGIEARHCHVEIIERVDRDDDPERRVTVVVSLTLSVGSDQAIPDRLTVLRERVREAVAREIGIEVRTVTIHVEDVHDV